MKRNPWRKGHLSIRLTRAMRLICIGFGFITSIGRQVGQQSKTPAERYLFIFNFFLLARCASERFYFHFSDGWIDIKGNCFKFLIEDKKVKNEIRGPCSFIPSSTSIMLFFFVSLDSLVLFICATFSCYHVIFYCNRALPNIFIPKLRICRLILFLILLW
jgi:hypothetical protein